jgi:1,4-dihydroxy-2-naphthoate octaprenyltransferase
VRDVATDTVARKRTLAVRFGAARARCCYAGCLVGALVAVVGCAFWHPWALLALAAAPLAITPIASRADALRSAVARRRARAHGSVPARAGRAARGRPADR